MEEDFFQDVRVSQATNVHAMHGLFNYNPQPHSPGYLQNSTILFTKSSARNIYIAPTIVPATRAKELISDLGAKSTHQSSHAQSSQDKQCTRDEYTRRAAQKVSLSFCSTLQLHHGVG